MGDETTQTIIGNKFSDRSVSKWFVTEQSDLLRLKNSFIKSFRANNLLSSVLDLEK